MSFEAFGKQSFPFQLEDGNTYNFSALTYADFAEIENYVKFREYHELAGKIDDKDILMKVMDRCLEKTITPDELDKEMNSLNVQLFLLYLSVNKQHHDLTLGKLGELVTIKSSQTITEQLMKISLPDIGGSGGTSKKKPQRSSKRATKNSPI